MNKIVVFGDSWCAYEGWPSILGIPRENCFAVCGSTADEWAGNKEGWLDRVKAADGDTLIFSLGGNDLMRKGVYATMGDMVYVCGLITRTLVALDTPKELLVVGIHYSSFNRGTQAALVSAPMAIAVEQCEGIMVRTSFAIEDYEPDGIHPNAAGFARIAEEIKRRVDLA